MTGIDVINWQEFMRIHILDGFAVFQDDTTTDCWYLQVFVLTSSNMIFIDWIFCLVKSLSDMNVFCMTLILHNTYTSYFLLTFCLVTFLFLLRLWCFHPSECWTLMLLSTIRVGGSRSIDLLVEAHPISSMSYPEPSTTLQQPFVIFLLDLQRIWTVPHNHHSMYTISPGIILWMRPAIRDDITL